MYIVIDVGLDIWVAYEHYNIADRDGTDEYASYYLYSTLFFIIVPQMYTSPTVPGFAIDTILHVLFTYLYTDGQQSHGTVV